MKFRKKPVVIDAEQFDGTQAEAERLRAKIRGAACALSHPDSAERGHWFIEIPTLEGTMWASRGDWIICGVKGEFSPCKPDVFEATYELESAPRSGVTHEQTPTVQSETTTGIDSTGGATAMPPASGAHPDDVSHPSPGLQRAPHSDLVGPVRVPGLDLDPFRALVTCWRDASEGHLAQANALERNSPIHAVAHNEAGAKLKHCANQLEEVLGRLRAGAPAPEPSDIEGDPAPFLPGRHPRPATIIVGAPAPESEK